MTMSKASEWLEQLLEDGDITYQHRLHAAELLLKHEASQRQLDNAKVFNDIEWQRIDRALKLEEAKFKADGAGEEIDRLAHFLTENYPRSIEGTAVDTAIKIMTEQEQELNDR